MFRVVRYAPNHDFIHIIPPINTTLKAMSLMRSMHISNIPRDAIGHNRDNAMYMISIDQADLIRINFCELVFPED